jgi:hypothetical protein
MTKEEFIQRAELIHGNEYLYTNVAKKVLIKLRVHIICPIHGSFWQIAESHLKGSGCAICSGNIRSNIIDFIEKARSIHGDKYNYDKSEYITSKDKMIITCSLHGDFLQNANNHLQGKGCPVCVNRDTLQEFITKANLIHDNKYDYTFVEYSGSKAKILIKCPKHGVFSQSAGTHLEGKGCQDCGKEKRTYSYSVWEKNGYKSNFFDSFKLYIISCNSYNETFYKIGKTYRTLGKRFSGKSSMPYEWSSVKIIYGSAKEISILENKLHHENRKNKYIPINSFNGSTECYSEVTNLE